METKTTEIISPFCGGFSMELLFFISAIYQFFLLKKYLLQFCAHSRRLEWIILLAFRDYDKHVSSKSREVRSFS